jgi:predicted PurR-regulated permease PerM
MESTVKPSELEDAQEASPTAPEPEPLRLRMPLDVRGLSLSVLAVVAVIFALQFAQAVFIPLALSVLISYALGPIVTLMVKWKIPRAIGAAGLLLAIVGTSSLLVYNLRDEGAAILEQLPAAAKKFRHLLREGLKEPEMVKAQKAANELEKAAAEAVGPPQPASPGVTRVQVEEPALNLHDYLWWGSMGAVAMSGQVLMILFLVYFMLASGDLFKRKLVKIAGPSLSEKKITVQILDEINEKIERFLLVQLFTSALVAAATWLAFRWVGLEQTGVWAIAAGLLNIIPYFGPVIVAGGITVVGFLQFGTIEMAALLAGITLVITSLEGYLLTPWLSGKAVTMNAVAVFVGLLFWGWIWGIWGLLLAVPIMMAVKVICDHIENLKAIGELLGEESSINRG